MSMMLMWRYIANDSTSASTKTNCRFSRDVSQRFSSIGGLGRLSHKSKVIARVFANWTVLELGEVLISMYRSSGVITFRFNSKTQRADVSVTFRRSWWCPSDTKLYKSEWNTFLNNAPMKNHTDLILGEVVPISIMQLSYPRFFS